MPQSEHESSAFIHKPTIICEPLILLLTTVIGSSAKYGKGLSSRVNEGKTVLEYNIFYTKQNEECNVAYKIDQIKVGNSSTRKQTNKYKMAKNINIHGWMKE